MRFLIFIFSVLLLSSCSKNYYASGVKRNQEAFKEYLRIISNCEEHKEDALIVDYLEAVDFMTFVTRIPSKAGYSSTVGYDSKEDYENDMRLWKG